MLHYVFATNSTLLPQCRSKRQEREGTMIQNSRTDQTKLPTCWQLSTHFYSHNSSAFCFKTNQMLVYISTKEISETCGIEGSLQDVFLLRTSEDTAETVPEALCSGFTFVFRVNGTILMWRKWLNKNSAVVQKHVCLFYKMLMKTMLNLI